MFKKLFPIIASALMTVAFLVPVSATLATPTFTKAETIVTDLPTDDDAYYVGESVTIGKDVRGDLVIGGGNVTVNGNVSGDIWILGGTVAINGRVGDDVRVVGGNVTITKEVIDDVMVGGGTVIVADTANIRGDLWNGAGEFNLYGHVFGNLMSWAGKARINGLVDGQATIRYSETLTFGNDGRIRGQLDYYSIAEDTSFATHAGKTVFHPVTDPGVVGSKMKELLTIAGITVVIWKLLSFLILGAMLIWIYPRLFPRVIDGIKAKENSSGFIWAGLLFFVAVPALAMVFAIILIGLPFTLLLLLVYALMLALGALVGAYAVGSYLRRHVHASEWDQLGNLALGLLVTIVVGYVPFLGWLFTFVVMLFGIGAILHEQRRLTSVYRNTPKAE